MKHAFPVMVVTMLALGLGQLVALVGPAPLRGSLFPHVVAAAVAAGYMGRHLLRERSGWALVVGLPLASVPVLLGLASLVGPMQAVVPEPHGLLRGMLLGFVAFLPGVVSGCLAAIAVMVAVERP